MFRCGVVRKHSFPVPVTGAAILTNEFTQSSGYAALQRAHARQVGCGDADGNASIGNRVMKLLKLVQRVLQMTAASLLLGDDQV